MFHNLLGVNIKGHVYLDSCVSFRLSRINATIPLFIKPILDTYLELLWVAIFKPDNLLFRIFRSRSHVAGDWPSQYTVTTYHMLRIGRGVHIDQLKAYNIWRKLYEDYVKLNSLDLQCFHLAI